MNKSEDELVLEQLYDIISESKVEMFDRIAALRTKHITVAMENIYQEHNASAVLRTCDCYGIQELHVIEKDNQYDIQRDIARGAGRWVNMLNFDRGSDPTLDCIQKLRKDGYKIVATTPNLKAKTIFDIEIEKPSAFIFGTERKGISDVVLNEADELVHIPMYGFTESFNISVSVAVLLNTLRQRLTESNISWLLSEKDQIKLKIEWCTKIIRSGKLLENEIRARLKQKD